MSIWPEESKKSKSESREIKINLFDGGNPMKSIKTKQLEALTRMSTYSYKNSKAFRLGTKDEKTWNEEHQKDMDKLVLKLK